MNKYSAVFSYLLQLKRIVWVLKDTNYQLKRDGMLPTMKQNQFRYK